MGDQIQLTVTGDPMGASDTHAFAKLLYSGSAGVTLGIVGEPACGVCPNPAWIRGAYHSGPGYVTVINTIGGLSPIPAPDPFVTLVVFAADSSGTLDFVFDPSTLHFFGVSVPAGASFTIVPEPSTALLFSLGLMGLGVRRRSGQESAL